MKALDRKWVWLGGAAAWSSCWCCPSWFKNYRVFQFNLVLVYAIAILGLNILTGFNGQFSLGHGAFYAFGAYTAAILMDKRRRALLGHAAAGLRVLLRCSAS
jgi:branched-chain amino acid transport system permease protein